MSKTNSNHRIIVGVDYGTTYTGVSYIETSSESTTDQVHSIRTFPGPGRDLDSPWKTPSRIAYSSENKDCKQNQFGFQVKPNMTSCSWTKLLLDSKSRPTEFDDPSLQRAEGNSLLRLPANKEAIEVVTDYLTELYKWIVSYMEKRISSKILEITPMEFWFSHPAIWSERAKSDTREAALRAGFGKRKNDRIFLIPEPEAAAIATLKGYAEKGRLAAISPGDGILICDCGGGTVDITSYKIMAVYPKLQFDELIEGVGGKCGSTYVDREFHRWMSTTFGSRYTNLRHEKTGPGSKFMREFEQWKIDFGSSEDLDAPYEMELVIPGIEQSGFYDTEESVVKIDGHIMLQFFQPVVDKITKMLGAQIADIEAKLDVGRINRILLVGGFGDSPFLNKRIGEWCNKRGIALTCPEHPQAAIAQGAALRGLDTVVPVQRRSRYHYGFSMNTPFRDGVDPENKAFTHIWTGQKWCQDRMTWEITKGQFINEKTKVEGDWASTYSEGDPLQYSETLYRCSAEKPPEYVDDPVLEKVAVITHTMRKADLDRFATKRHNGKQKWHTKWQRSIFLGKKEGTLAVKYHYQGIELGSSDVGFDSVDA